MIEVSSYSLQTGPPIDNNYYQEKTDKTPESSAASSTVFEETQKKNKLGVFAKILEGLTVKLSKGHSGNITEEGQKPLSSAKKAANSLFGKDTGSIDSLENEFLASFTPAGDQNTLKTRQGLIKENDGRLTNQSSLRVVPKEPAAELAAELPLEVEAQADSLVPGEEDAESFLQLYRVLSGEKERNPRNTAFFSASFREMEAEVQQQQAVHSQAELDPQLSQAGSERENVRLERGKRGKDRPNLEVRDLRTGESQSGTSNRVELAAAVKEAGASRTNYNSENEISIDLNLFEARGRAVAESADNSFRTFTFEDALASELRGNLSGDIVRSAAVILRNGSEGTIKLSLHPASLGDVKIRLEMTENKITGHIILESDEALRAFERELPVLEKAFRDSGFSETNLQMFLAQENSANGSYGRNERQEESFLNQVLAASRYEAESEQFDLNRPEALVPNGRDYSLLGRTPVNLLI